MKKKGLEILFLLLHCEKKWFLSFSLFYRKTNQAFILGIFTAQLFENISSHKSTSSKKPASCILVYIPQVLVYCELTQVENKKTSTLSLRNLGFFPNMLQIILSSLWCVIYHLANAEVLHVCVSKSVNNKIWKNWLGDATPTKTQHYHSTLQAAHYIT